MAKGSSNERDIAKFLTKWLTGKNKPYMFWRQDASGGLATVHIENYHMTGDITSIHTDSKFFTDVFTVECKTGYPSTSFWQHFKCSNFAIKDFWKQTVEDAEKSNKYPMLIYRKKYREWIVGIDEKVSHLLSKRLLDLNHAVLLWNKENGLRSCLLYHMKDFFDVVTPNDVNKIKERMK